MHLNKSSDFAMKVTSPRTIITSTDLQVRLFILQSEFRILYKHCRLTRDQTEKYGLNW